MDRLRVGLVGAGYMAKAHSLAFRNAPGFGWPDVPAFDLVRVADRRVEAAEAAAARWGWAASTDDWRAVTRADDIDVVDVITPNDSHAEIVVDAFAHGKHVICEKPLANELAGARAMLAAERASGRVGIVNFVYRVWPAIEHARRLIDEGRLGTLRMFEGHCFQDYALEPDAYLGWRARREVSGGGAFADIGAHIADLARHLMGDIVRVAATTRRFVDDRPAAAGGSERVPSDVEDLGATLVEFASGATGSIHASWAATGHRCDLGFTVIGSKGALKFTWERSNELLLFTTDDPAAEAGFRRIVLSGLHPGAEHFWFAAGQGLGYGEAFVLTVMRLVRAIRGEGPASPSIADGLRCLELVHAAYEAAATGRWVTLERSDG